TQVVEAGCRKNPPPGDRACRDPGFDKLNHRHMKGPLLTDTQPLRVGMVGYAFMGAAPSHAWRTAPPFFDLPLQPRLTALAGRNPEAVKAAADKLGWETTETDWRALIE